MAMRCMGRTERQDYLLGIVDVRRISAGWWLFILFAYPLVNAVAVGADVLLGGALPTMVTLRAVAANPISLVPLLLLSFMSGPFSEELGWRGFALRPLTQRFGFGWAAVGLGLVWAAWHLPLYMMPETWHGSVGFGLYGFVSFVALSVGLSLSMGVVFLRTRGSILSAMLLHLSSNLTSPAVAGGRAARGVAAQLADAGAGHRDGCSARLANKGRAGGAFEAEGGLTLAAGFARRKGWYFVRRSRGCLITAYKGLLAVLNSARPLTVKQGLVHKSALVLIAPRKTRVTAEHIS